jgi:hypothetical protein
LFDSIVTSNTSLIVLETLEQYLKYKIEPPQGLTAIYEAYMAAISKETKSKEELEEMKVLNVMSFWNRRVKWWNNHYSGTWQPGT